VPPFAFDLSLGSYAGFNPPVPEAVDRYAPGSFRRLLRGASTALYLVELTVARLPAVGPDPAVEVHCWPELPAADRAALERVAGWMIGEELDLAPFYALAADDPTMQRVIEPLRGLRPPRTPDPFEAFVIAITEQLTSIKTAATLRSRLVARYGETLRCEDGRTTDRLAATNAQQTSETLYAFPTPEALAAANADDVRAMGFMSGRAACLVRFAQLVADGTLDLAALGSLPFEEILTTLRTVKGIGRWTTAYALSRGYGRYDVFPEGDLALRAAVSRRYRGGAVASDADVRAILGRYGEYKGLAAFYLIMSYALERYGPHGRVPKQRVPPPAATP
jgi:DNA-3-methyladenine glycosylase II